MDARLITLLNKAENGDCQAFKAIVDTYVGGLYSLVFGMLRNHDDTHDVMQDTFIKVYRSLSSLKNKGAFKTWLYRIAVNTANNRLKTKIRKREREQMGEPLPEIKFEDRNLEMLEKKEMQQLVYQALGHLPSEHQMVVVLVELKGMSCVEVGDILECPAGTVRSRLHYAKKKLYEILLPHRTLIKGDES